MPSFGVKVPHPLDQDSAIERLRAFIDEMHREHKDRVQNVEQRWEENHLVFSFSTSGVAISGRIIVETQLARVEGQLPFAAVFFRGKIEQEIRDRLQKLLHNQA